MSVPCLWFVVVAHNNMCVHGLQAKCEEVKKQKELALAAKAKAENDYANARTQQVGGGWEGTAATARHGCMHGLCSHCAHGQQPAPTLHALPWRAPYARTLHLHLLTCPARPHPCCVHPTLAPYTYLT